MTFQTFFYLLQELKNEEDFIHCFNIHFWANASRVTVGVDNQTYNIIGSNKTKVTLTTPVTNPSVTIQYGFYSSEVSVKYSF